MNPGKNTFILFLMLISLLEAPITQAQDLLKLKDISSVKVNALSELDIMKISQQLTNAGVTVDDVRGQLMSRGMSTTEFMKLKERISLMPQKGKLSSGKYSANDKSVQGNSGQARQVNSIDNEREKFNEDTSRQNNIYSSAKMRYIFGSELFVNAAVNGKSNLLKPDLNIASPLNYELGPGDQLKIVLFGLQEFNDDLSISPEGFINIMNVGLVKVAGLTLEAAQSRIKQFMRKTYPTLSNGSSTLSISIGDIRTIRVTVIGANNSGSFDVPSLSTVYSVLSLASGPSPIGSFRQIELVRNNKVIKKIDLYRLLAKGDQSDNVRLKDNDIIRIPAYANRVELSGQVKRAGLFEVLAGESFKDMLEFAGGFDDTAYTAMIKVIRKSTKERVVKDLVETEFSTFKPETGDLFVVSKILDRFTNRVQISGPVFRPDMYEFSEGMRISDLIRKADGLKEDAFLERGLLMRRKEDFTKEIISVNLLKALKHDKEFDLNLKREDVLMISSIADLKDSLFVSLQGEVHSPGDYLFIDGMTLKGLILQAGGFTDAASSTIEIAHMISRDSVSSNDTRASITETIHVKDSLKFGELDFTIKPYDVITIRKKPAYNSLETVYVSGEVQFPGPYALKDAQERVSDLVKRVGGFLPNASIDGAYLKRYKNEEARRRIKDATRRMQSLYADSSGTVLTDIDKEVERIPIDLAYILSFPGSIQDVILTSRDELIVPKLDVQVRVSGAVLQSTQIPFEPTKSFRSYIYSAGGFSRDAWRKRAYIVYANGKAKTVRSFLFFRTHPTVKPGSEIIVPKQPMYKRSLPFGEMIGISSAIASLAGVVIAILRL